MNTKKITIPAMAALAFLAFSCSDDDGKSQQNPLKSYLAATGFDEEVTEAVDDGDYEFGYAFTPDVDGDLEAVVVKIPDVNNALRVTIWDAEDGSILRTITVDAATAGKQYTKKLDDDLDLFAGHEYMITMNSNDWYNYERTDGSDATYPVEAGDFMVTGYGYVGGTTQTFPGIGTTSYYAGDVSFKFEKD
jgi:uncharacterized protein DUF4082